MGKCLFMRKGGFVTSPLPAGYTRLEWIESTGTQYIDTGFIADQNARIVMNCKATSIASNASFAFGSRESATDAGVSAALTQTQAFYSCGGTYQFANFADVYGRITIDANKTIATFTGATTVSISLAASTFKTPTGIILCSVYDAAEGGIHTGTRAFHGQIYSCQIYDDGTLVRDYVPCVSPAGAVGLYDMVGGQFYGNAGTGSFIGSEVA